MDRRIEARNRLIIALDTANPSDAANRIQHLNGHCGYFKVGSTFESAVGQARAMEMARALKTRVFLDKKFHDIPEQVAGAMLVACEQGANIINCHAAGGPKMLEAARKAVDEWCKKNPDKERPLLFAVTLLTSIDYAQAIAIGVCQELNIHDEQERLETQEMYLHGYVRRMARLVEEAGFDGAICSAQEASMIRRYFNSDDLKLLTPAIRPKSAKPNDQKRITTPEDAIKAGSDLLVVGRPITEADDQVAAAESIIDQIEAAMPADL